jgi:hypothetical protein
MNKTFKLKLTSEDVRILIASLEGAEDIEAVTLQLEDFLSEIEFNETVNDCDLDSDMVIFSGDNDDEGCSL